MSWFKVDDKFHDHNKPDGAGKAAIGVWTLCGSWSADHLTDGFVPDRILRRHGSLADAERLVAAGLWVVAEGGWRFHDWSTYQPTKAEIEAQRKVWRDKKAKTKKSSSGESPGSSPGEALGESSGEALEIPGTRPVPSRPAAKAAAAQPQIESLKTALGQAKLTARWDKLSVEQVAQVVALVERHSVAALVKAASKAHRPDSPASFAQAWLPMWEQLPVLSVVTERPYVICEEHGMQRRADGSCAMGCKASKGATG